ncbi:MAG: cytochrome C [Geobacteraceae bacterium GWC2_53_11]|nr:MAG: cytochrome C [Geobacteraceae bacterium GWC2_53_11]
MRTILFTAVAIVISSSIVFAADVMELPTTKNSVTFPHKRHQLKLADCTKCHESSKGGKIANLGKEWAHKHCRECHHELKKGPQACRDCHKKIATKK